MTLECSILAPDMPYGSTLSTIAIFHTHKFEKAHTFQWEHRLQYKYSGLQELLHKGSNEELDNALIARLVAPHFSMLLLGSAALSNYALSGLLTTIDPGYLKANVVQVVGEVGKAFPAELATILQVSLSLIDL